jgi:hypothetical protein
MANLDDILGRKVHKSDEYEVVEVDGMCGFLDDKGNFCFYPYVHGTYYPKRKKLTLECSMGHKTEIDWEING